MFFVKTSDALVATIHGVLRYAQNDEVKLSRLGGLCRECVGGFGDDDPCGEVSEEADTGQDDDQNGDDAYQVEVPAVVEREAGADSCDHAVLTRAGELAGALVGAACRGWRSGRDGGSAGWAEAGVGVYLLATLGTEHECLREDSILPYTDRKRLRFVTGKSIPSVEGLGSK